MPKNRSPARLERLQISVIAKLFNGSDQHADVLNFAVSADVWLTVPAAWDAKGCNMMRDAAISAGLVQSSHAGDRDWRDRLRIITYVANPHALVPC